MWNKLSQSGIIGKQSVIKTAEGNQWQWISKLHLKIMNHLNLETALKVIKIIAMKVKINKKKEKKKIQKLKSNVKP